MAEIDFANQVEMRNHAGSSPVILPKIVINNY